jgi:uncharacterized membrane protein (UPF0127 family)
MIISINNNTFFCKVVSTSSQIKNGMMGKTFDGFEGMFFIMPNEGQQNFWMKKCLVPLDIIFISNNIIQDISPNCSPCDSDECPTYSGYGGFVLELPGGTCRSKKIKIGDTVVLN